MNEWILAIIGGLAIGLGAALLLLTSGRVAGVSGICAGLWQPRTKEFKWRLVFVLGLISSAMLWAIVWPERFPVSFSTHWERSIIGGFLVGFGTRLANGCTSGHGVCGVARLSKRSIAATAIFLSTAIATVAAVRLFSEA